MHYPIANRTVSTVVGLAAFPEILLNRALISPSDLVAAQSRAARERLELADAVVAAGVNEGDTYAALAAAAGADVIEAQQLLTSELAVRLVPERLARRHSVVPLAVDNRLLTYATCRPFNAEAESDLGFASGRRTAVKVATRSSVAAALNIAYPKDKPSVAVEPRVAPADASGALRAPQPAVLDMCHAIIVRALDAGWRDVHITCGSGPCRIQGGTGGALGPFSDVPTAALGSIGERFKIMARVGSAVKNRPQNGSFLITIKDRVADVRLSTTPTPTGEDIVLRITDGRAARAGWNAVAQLGKNARPRVLMTDDDAITRMLVRVLLERDRYLVSEATNGREAVELARREHPSLVLMDLNMPVMDGYEAIRALRDEFPSTALPIIVLTADDGDSVQRRVLELGADDYLVKPFEPAVLTARVNAVFRRLSLRAA